MRLAHRPHQLGQVRGQHPRRAGSLDEAKETDAVGLFGAVATVRSVVCREADRALGAISVDRRRGGRTRSRWRCAAGARTLRSGVLILSWGDVAPGVGGCHRLLIEDSLVLLRSLGHETCHRPRQVKALDAELEQLRGAQDASSAGRVLEEGLDAAVARRHLDEA